jgi:hypothetical protein
MATTPDHPGAENGTEDTASDDRKAHLTDALRARIDAKGYEPGRSIPQGDIAGLLASGLRDIADAVELLAELTGHSDAIDDLIARQVQAATTDTSS